jgi:predicted 2-oxoglutarate/Fe(II)-dependent dioxygenase YbiX
VGFYVYSPLHKVGLKNIMVNSNTDISADTAADISGGDGLPPVVIEDTTPQDQLDLEADVVLGSDLDTPTTDETGDAGIDAGDDGGIGVEPQAEPVTEPVAQDEEARINDLITKRMAGIQSAADQRVAAAEKAQRIAAEEAQKHSIDAAVEQALRTQELHLTEEMGEDSARRYVRDEANAKAVREQLTQRVEIENLRQGAVQQGIENRGILMTQWFGNLQATHNLEEADMAILRQMVTRESLSSDEAFLAAGDVITPMAERLAKATPATRSKRVPPATPETNPGTGRSTNNQPTSDASLTASAREKPAYQWTPEENAAMRRAAHGG